MITGKGNEVGVVKKRWHSYIKDFFKEYCIKGHYGKGGLNSHFIFYVQCLFFACLVLILSPKTTSQFEAWKKQYIFLSTLLIVPIFLIES